MIIQHSSRKSRLYVYLFSILAAIALFACKTSEAIVQTANPQTQAAGSPTGLMSDWTRPADGMVMVYVPEGEFTMGSILQDYWKPVHVVYLDAYWIDRTEVTNAMFTVFVDDTGYETDAEKNGASWIVAGNELQEMSGADWEHPRGPGSSISSLGDYPVVQVSWNDAAAYCAWAGARLPTEAEWEKAARGTDSRAYPWGEQTPDGNLVNFADVSLAVEGADTDSNDGYMYTAPAGTYPAGASPYGALDMAGNVFEWVADWYGESYYSSSPGSNPTGPSSGDYHVMRGGGWGGHENYLRSAARYAGRADVSSDLYGFRCSRSLSSSTPTLTPTYTSTVTPVPSTDAPSVVIRLGPGRYGNPLWLEVIEGNYTLVSGATLRAGSAVGVAEDWLTFPRGLAIDVEGGDIVLQGTTYPQGTKLIVDTQGNLIPR